MSIPLAIKIVVAETPVLGWVVAQAADGSFDVTGALTQLGVGAIPVAFMWLVYRNERADKLAAMAAREADGKEHTAEVKRLNDAAIGRERELAQVLGETVRAATTAMADVKHSMDVTLDKVREPSPAETKQDVIAAQLLLALDEVRRLQSKGSPGD